MLTDVCPFTLGTAAFNEPYVDELSYFPIIERNCVVPISIVRRLYTASHNQSVVGVKVYQAKART